MEFLYLLLKPDFPGEENVGGRTVQLFHTINVLATCMRVHVDTPIYTYTYNFTEREKQINVI